MTTPEQLDALGQGRRPEEVAGQPAESLTPALGEEVSFRLTVPATSANLGPGYDCLGLAFELRDDITITARPRQHPEEPHVEVTVSGQGAEDLAQDASHLVVAVVERILAAKGYELPDLSVQAENRIPHSRGLGSSAAAIASAVVTAAELIPEGLSPEEKLHIGASLEGHPDNYAPALNGGAAVSWVEGTGDVAQFFSSGLQLHPSLRTVVAMPDFTQSTQVARDLLPTQIPHAQAAANSARSALLIHALTTAPEYLVQATEDRLHQEYRRAAFPESMELVDYLRREGFAAVISGAGPAVLVLCPAESAQAASAAIDDYCRQRNAVGRFAPMELPIAASGATVEASR